MYRTLRGWAQTAVLLAGFGASAETWTLSWVRGPGAETCLDGAALSSAVERRLGRSPFGATGGLLLEGLVQRDGAGWSAFVAIRDRQGKTLGVREHHSDADSCEALSEPLALIVALLIDPSSAFATPPAPAPVPVAPAPLLLETAAAPAPSAPPADAPSQPPANESAPLALGAAAAMGVGQLSDWTPGLRVELEGRLGPVGLGLAVEGWWPTRHPLGSGAARLGQVGLDALVCPLWVSLGSGRLGGCASALFGVLLVQGSGFATNRSTAGPVVDLGARGVFSWPVGPAVALTVGLGVRGHLLSTTLSAADAGGQLTGTFSGLPVAIDLGAGVSFRLR